MATRSTSQIPIVDIFAGPGGLGEGFSAFTDARGNRPFKIAISVEKETNAHKTLLVRSFYRQFSPGEAPPVFYQHLRGEITYESFMAGIETTPEGIAALDEARQHELGADPGKDAELSRLIAKKIAGRECVLIGGPPCQAYSLVGRSRNMGREDYTLETDPKAKLYLEYLQLIADLAPAVFVMENVKGLLSSRMDGMRVFDKIRGDLCNPAEALRREGRRRSGTKATYRLHALSQRGIVCRFIPA
jgi:DNA (cytosine-5)-methyltransferase 1